jgi:hypothetical protein
MVKLKKRHPVYNAIGLFHIYILGKPSVSSTLRKRRMGLGLTCLRSTWPGFNPTHAHIHTHHTHTKKRMKVHVHLLIFDYTQRRKSKT